MSAINQSKIVPNNFAFVYGAPEGPRAFVSTTSCASWVHKDHRRVYGPKKMSSPTQKDFCNTIGAKRT